MQQKCSLYRLPKQVVILYTEKDVLGKCHLLTSRNVSTSRAGSLRILMSGLYGPIGLFATIPCGSRFGHVIQTPRRRVLGGC